MYPLLKVTPLFSDIFNSARVAAQEGDLSYLKYVKQRFKLCKYSGPPLMWPTLGNENCGHIRWVAACEG